MQNFPDISVIIVNFQGRQCIGKCLASVPAAVGRYTFEIIVVDNNSTDKSDEYIAEHFHDVHLIRNQQNAGYSQACNQGIKHSKGHYLCLLNPDLYLEKNALQTLVDFLKDNPDTGSVSPKLFNCDGSLQPVCRKFLKSRHLVIKHLVPWRFLPPQWAGRFVLEYWDHNSNRDVDWFCGACMVFAREMIDRVGLKDENFWSFHEDTDWLKRVNEAGYRVVFVHDARGTHEGGHSMKQLFRDKKIIYEYQAKHQFILKHYGQKSLVVHRILLAMLLLFRKLRLVRSSPRDEFFYQKVNIIDKCIALQLNINSTPRVTDHISGYYPEREMVNRYGR